MAVNSNNIEIGEGDLSLKYEGEAAATDVGGCSDAELDIKVKNLSVEVGQLIDPVDNFMTGREINFSITMKEDTMRNFVIAAGGDPEDIVVAAGEEQYDFPANSVSTSPYAELIYKVSRVRNKLKFRTLTLWKVKALGGIKYAYNKNKEVMYKVTFTAFADSAHAGSPGKMERDPLV